MSLQEQVSRTPEQEQLRSSVRRFFADHVDEPAVRRLADSDSGVDADLHARLAGALGVHGLAVPEEHGGSGAGWVEVALVAEEAGRCLYGGPYLSTAVLSVAALLASDDRRALPGVADGTTVAALAFVEQDRSWDAGGTTMRAVPSGDGWALTGQKRFVVDGHVADLLLVTAGTDDGVALFAVEGQAPGVTREQHATLDRTRRLAAVRLDGAPGVLIGDGLRAVDAAVTAGCVALAAEQLGGAQRLLELSTGFALDREQFGRPIGGFQAIKHLLADVLIGVESARSLAHHAAWALTAGRPEAASLAHTAQSYCSELFLSAARTTIQVHGGTGFTWEHPAHLYYRRAKSDELLLGTPAEHRAALADLLGV
ncbi:MAG: acyl-CoA dehydrogenase protein [Frankiales bacterium]|nr:acyl-CoA dehydrogenase protein [Frankiales bacterium]